MNTKIITIPEIERTLSPHGVRKISETIALKETKIEDLSRKIGQLEEAARDKERELQQHQTAAYLQTQGHEAIKRIESLEGYVKQLSGQIESFADDINQIRIKTSALDILDRITQQTTSLAKEVKVLEDEISEIRQRDDAASAKFEALNPVDKVDWVKKHGVPLHLGIRKRKISVHNLQKNLPVRVPLNETLEEHTRGHMGKITCWFNPAVTWWKGKQLLMYRCECYPFWRHGRLGLCETTDDWEPIAGTERWMNVPGRQGFAESEDGRFLVHKGQLLIAYNTGIRQMMAWLKEDLTMERSIIFDSDEFLFTDREKNWSFFTHDDKLFAIYSQAPQCVISVNEKTGKVVKFSEDKAQPRWEFGYPRGGASPVLHKGLYYHFIHSSISIASGLPDQTWGVQRRYHIGLAIFESTPPFKYVTSTKYPLVSGSPEPCIEFYSPSDHSVVFPGSAHRNASETGWVLAVGVNDRHSYIYEIPDTLIEQRMS